MICCNFALTKITRMSFVQLDMMKKADAIRIIREIRSFK